VVGTFLEKVARLAEEKGDRALDSDGRLGHGLLLEAFDDSARDFIGEVKQELYFALNFSSEIQTNKSLVNELLDAFAGLPTPFVHDDCLGALSDRLNKKLSPTQLRDALRQMKEMGIFEIHPVDVLKWRAGRLFKEALRMKYVR
jgi:hypothetical protein